MQKTLNFNDAAIVSVKKIIIKDEVLNLLRNGDLVKKRNIINQIFIVEYK